MFELPLASENGSMYRRALRVASLLSIACCAGRAAAAPQFVWLGDLPGGGFSSGALDVSGDGATVVRISESGTGTDPGKRPSSGMQGLGEIAGAGSVAKGVSGDGSIVVGEGAHYGGMRELDQVLISQGLDLTGGKLFGATDISDDGRTIVGYGLGPSDRLRSMVRLDPRALDRAPA